MFKNILDFIKYREWCLERNLKPSNPIALKSFLTKRYDTA